MPGLWTLFLHRRPWVVLSQAVLQKLYILSIPPTVCNGYPKNLNLKQILQTWEWRELARIIAISVFYKIPTSFRVKKNYQRCSELIIEFYMHVPDKDLSKGQKTNCIDCARPANFSPASRKQCIKTRCRHPPCIKTRCRHPPWGGHVPIPRKSSMRHHDS